MTSICPCVAFPLRFTSAYFANVVRKLPVIVEFDSPTLVKFSKSFGRKGTEQIKLLLLLAGSLFQQI